MKTRIKVLLVMLSVAFFSTTAYATIENTINPIELEINNQEETVLGVYKGHDESGYNFSMVDAKGEKSAVLFSSAVETVAKSNDLDSKAVIGTTYEITYTVAEDGTKTITALKPQY